MATLFNDSSPSQSPIPSPSAVTFTSQNRLLLSCTCLFSLALISTITGFFIHNRRKRRLKVDIESQSGPNSHGNESFPTIPVLPFTPSPPNRQTIFGSPSPGLGSPRGKDSPSKPSFVSTTVSAVDPWFRDSDVPLMRPKLRFEPVNASVQTGSSEDPPIKPMLRLANMDAGQWAREASVNLDDVFEVSSPALSEDQDFFPTPTLRKKTCDRARRYGLVGIAVSIEYSADDGSHVRLSMKASCSTEHIQNALMKLVGTTRRSPSSSTPNSRAVSRPDPLASSKSNRRPRPRPLRPTPQRSVTDGACQSAVTIYPRTNSPLMVSFVWPIPRGMSLPLFSPTLTQGNMQPCGCRSFLSMGSDDEHDGICNSGKDGLDSGQAEGASTVFSKIAQGSGRSFATLVKGRRPSLGRGAMRMYARSGLGSGSGTEADAQRYCLLGTGLVSGVSSGGSGKSETGAGGSTVALVTAPSVQTPRIPFRALPRLSMVMEDDESLRALLVPEPQQERTSCDDITEGQADSAYGYSGSGFCKSERSADPALPLSQQSCGRSPPVLFVHNEEGDSRDLASMIQSALEGDIVSGSCKLLKSTKCPSPPLSSPLSLPLSSWKLSSGDLLSGLATSPNGPLLSPSPTPWPCLVTLKLSVPSTSDILNIIAPEDISFDRFGSKVLSRLKRDYTSQADSSLDSDSDTKLDSGLDLGTGTASNMNLKLSSWTADPPEAGKRTISE